MNTIKIKSSKFHIWVSIYGQCDAALIVTSVLVVMTQLYDNSAWAYSSTLHHAYLFTALPPGLHTMFF